MAATIIKAGSASSGVYECLKFNMVSLVGYLLALAVVSAIVLSKVLHYGMRPKGYPPGPPTIPILGNLHQMPRRDFYLQFQKWAEQYGPIVSLKLGSQTMILLSSDKVIKELLDKRSQNTSSRMDMFLSEFGGNNQILMRTNDETWRRQRKMYHIRLNSKVADSYLPYQAFETLQLMSDLLEDPDAYTLHLKRYTASIGSTVVYGWRVPSMNLAPVNALYEWTNGQVRIGVTTAVTDWYPFLRPIFRYMPPKISSFRDEMKRLNRLETDLWMSLLEDSKRKIKEGKMNPSFCRDMILSNTEKDDYLSEKEIAFNAGHAWAAASDTQYNTLLSFVKAMTIFPEVQKRAQEELDRVVGKNNLPEWKDWERLPYVRGCMKETLRWAPATILGGMPHAVSKDDVYNGYTIPAGAGLLNNVWTINNDPSRTPNPRQFEPLRFRDDALGTAESATQVNSAKRDHFTFGAGRRICPGTHVADRGLFLAMSRLLWAFSFSEVPGHPIDPDALTQGFIVAPVPYKCKISPRDGVCAARIREDWQSACSFLDEEANYKQEYFTQMFGSTKS